VSMAAAPARQRMEPAPVLPPVLPGPVLLAPSGPPDPVRGPAAAGPVSAQEVVSSVPPVAVPATGALDALVAAHEAHLLAMARMHEQFLAQQGAAAAQILALGAAPGRASQPRATAQSAPAAAPAPSRPVPSTVGLPGPKVVRAQLEELATMRRSVSSLFGPEFAAQDDHRYQIRIPAPPMLFTDRILGFDGTARSLGRGRVWAELDLTEGMFGLDPAGRASIFLLGEAGQASMLLASWLGADLCHDGRSRYRVLDLDMTVHGSLPKAGDILRTQIALQRHAVAGGMRLFFFEADASVGDRLVARGRFSTGLFTEAELAQPAEVAWSPPSDPSDPGGAPGPSGAPGLAHAGPFGPESLAALREGRVADCFGEGHRGAAAHTRTPGAATPELFLLDSVEAFEPAGGPARHGYLRATHAVAPGNWYFAAHLPGDPCMPGFLVLDGAFQALAFYLTAMGVTIPRDGWRFEPSHGARSACRFRGQILPQSAPLVYEIFVESLSTGPVPAIVADVTGRLDGRIIFHGRRLMLQLIPD
jgi:3-hydroxymyristoyl/3-hydroxydecanoyl-(acyl carrier protein) dehydratase